MAKEKDVDLESEFRHVTKCAKDNKLLLNMAKTKELIFHIREMFHLQLSCLELKKFCAKLQCLRRHLYKKAR